MLGSVVLAIVDSIWFVPLLLMVTYSLIVKLSDRH